MSEKVCLKSRMQQMQVNRAPPALCLLTLSVVQEEKTEGRGRRKRKLSTHKVAAVKESGDEKDEMESKEQPSAEVNTTLFTSIKIIVSLQKFTNKQWRINSSC